MSHGTGQSTRDRDRDTGQGTQGIVHGTGDTGRSTRNRGTVQGTQEIVHGTGARDTGRGPRGNLSVIEGDGWVYFGSGTEMGCRV